MPYIIVRCRMNLGSQLAFQACETHIEFNVDDGGQDELRTLQSAMSSLGASGYNLYPEYPGCPGSSPSFSYQTSQPPFLVLNRLEKHCGYKVVAVNSVTDPHTDQRWWNSVHYQIWTLHKQA